MHVEEVERGAGGAGGIAGHVAVADGGAVSMARAQPGLPYGRTLRDLVRAGRIGAVTYVTVADRRTGGADAAAAQCASVAVQQLDDLARVFDGEPTRILARLAPGRTEAWLELANGIRLHYDGMLAPAPAAHELWVDGALGALRVAHGCLWWRRRGWRWFVPIGLRGRPLDAGAAGATRRAALLAAALEADRGQAMVSLNDPPSAPASVPAERVLAP